MLAASRGKDESWLGVVNIAMRTVIGVGAAEWNTMLCNTLLALSQRRSFADEFAAVHGLMLCLCCGSPLLIGLTKTGEWFCNYAQRSQRTQVPSPRRGGGRRRRCVTSRRSVLFKKCDGASSHLEP